MNRGPDFKARTERVALQFTQDEWADLNAMRKAAGNPPMAGFVRGLILDVVADDKAEHAGEAAE